MNALRHTALILGPVLLLLALPLVAEVLDRVPPPRPPAVPGSAVPGPLGAPSPVIYPPGTVPLAFDHATHAAADCAACHPDVARSTRAADRNLPAEEACAACHPVTVAPGEDAAAVCGRCHPGYRPPAEPPRFRPGDGPRGRADVLEPPAPVSLPAPYLRFDHAVHAAAGIECATCHGSLPGRALPLMSECLGCHDGRRAPAACRTCHLTDGAGRVRWRLPTGRLVPSGRSFDDRHDEAFLREHGPAAARDRRHCAECHDDAWCQACHDGAARPARVHPADWVALHAVPARKDPRGCAACHRSSGDCIVCHRRSHVVAEGEQAFPGDRPFHPDGWSVPDGSLPGAAHHGREARRNLRACASCHREETCIACHRSRTSPAGPGRGVFANPHGRDFRERCAAMLSRNAKVCERCHAASDAALDVCR